MDENTIKLKKRKSETIYMNTFLGIICLLIPRNKTTLQINIAIYTLVKRLLTVSLIKPDSTTTIGKKVK